MGGVAGAQWGDMDELDLGGDDVFKEASEEKVATLGMGDTLQTKWLRRRRLPCDLVAAGEFEEALTLLRKRLGLINPDPLEPLFREAYWATCSSLPSIPQGQSLQWPMLSAGTPKLREIAPMILYTSKSIADKVKEGFKLTTEGKFPEALTVFRDALQ